MGEGNRNTCSLPANQDGATHTSPRSHRHWSHSRPAGTAARSDFLIRSGGCNAHLGLPVLLSKRNCPDGPVN